MHSNHERLPYPLRYLVMLAKKPGTQIRVAAVTCIILAYGLFAWLHQFASPMDLTYLVQHGVNRRIFHTTHAMMTSFPAAAIGFKFVYYFGFSLCLFFTPIYLGLLQDMRRLDLFMSSLIVVYAIVFPIFFTAVVYEPVSVGWGYMEDMMLYEGQSLNDSNFMTNTAFCLPSGHVFLTVICALSVLGTGSRFRYAFYAMAVLVPISTILLTQHWIEDLITGFLVAFLAFYLAKYLRPYLTAFHEKRVKGLERRWLEKMGDGQG